jgi:hypothetical protein
MAYSRTKLNGEVFVPGSGTTGSGVADFPGAGISVVSVTSSETYCLETPQAGRRKTIVLNMYTTTIAPEIWASTAAAGGVTFMGGTTGYTKLKYVAAGRSTVAATVIELVGRNSTQWIVTSVFPVTTATTGGTMIGGCITMSS